MSEQTRDAFARMAQQTGRPMSQLLDDAADALERRLFFERLNEGYAQLRADPEAWAEVEAERALEANALSDSSE